MPIYEYVCDACDTPFERIQSIRDPAIPDCPGCGATSVRRLISSSSFQLKGSGWYATDYKRSAGPRSTGSSGDSGSSEAA